MNKWMLLAGVMFLSALGVCYTLLAHQGFVGIGHPESQLPTAGASDVDFDANSDAPLDDESEGTFSRDDTTGDGTVKPKADAPFSASRTDAAGSAQGKRELSPIETIEDDEEVGITMDPDAPMDDSGGIVEPTEMSATSGIPKKASATTPDNASELGK